MFYNGNGSLPRSANLSFSYHCDISSPAVTTSTIEPSVSSITSMTSTDVISTPSPSPMSCCYVTTSSIEPSVSTTPTSSIEPSDTVISMFSTTVIFTPSPSPLNCSIDGIWPETLPGYNVTGSYCYKGTINGK